MAFLLILHVETGHLSLFQLDGFHRFERQLRCLPNCMIKRTRKREKNACFKRRSNREKHYNHASRNETNNELPVTFFQLYSFLLPFSLNYILSLITTQHQNTQIQHHMLSRSPIRICILQFTVMFH